MADANDIKNLRAQTGAGVMDVKNALEEAGGDAEKAKEILRKKGATIAAKKGDRQANDHLPREESSFSHYAECFLLFATLHSL